MFVSKNSNFEIAHCDTEEKSKKREKEKMESEYRGK